MYKDGVCALLNAVHAKGKTVATGLLCEVFGAELSLSKVIDSFGVFLQQACVAHLDVLQPLMMLNPSSYYCCDAATLYEPHNVLEFSVTGNGSASKGHNHMLLPTEGVPTWRGPRPHQ